MNDINTSNAILSSHELLDLITSMVEASSQRRVASDLGVSPSWLGDVLHGRRPVSEAMARKLGLRRVVVFVVEDDPCE